MKRLALLLGSLLVVSAAASAKEVVPAPVVVEEVPVQIVEKEVIVYRDRAPEWRPTGSVDLSQDYYGKTENQKREWNGNNKYTRTVLEGEVALTENQRMDFRTRWYQSVDHRAINKNNNDLRVRYYYNHGELMGIPATTRLQYENAGENSLEYRMEFDFAKYFFNNDYVKTTSAVIAPTYKYTWARQAAVDPENKEGKATSNTTYTNTLGLYANFVNQLPYGFGFELEFDGLNFSKHHGDSPKYWNGNSWESKDKEFVATINAKLTHGWNLYSEGDLSVDWAFEGGYDSYALSNLRQYATLEAGDKEFPRGERAKYSLMAKPEVSVSYAATKFVNLYAKVGAEYRNWTVETQSEASHWRWQPYATVGVKTTF